MLGSIPAACWLSAETEGQILLHVDDDLGIQAVTIHAPCSLSNGDSVQDARRGNGAAHREEIRVVRSMRAPEIPLPMGKFAGLFDLESPGTPQSIGQDEEQKEQGSKTDKDTENVKKDERTWLQKNWLLVAAGVFLIVNKIGAAAQDAQGVQQPGGASRPAPRR